MSRNSYDITLIMPPMWSNTVPWTAPGYLSESLRERGYKVQFLDYNIRLFRLCEKLGYANLWENSAFFTPWTSGQLDYMVHMIDLDEIQAPVVGFCTTQTSIGCSIAMAERIREHSPNRKIILGGQPVFFPEEVNCIPLSAADAICKGEGERTLCEVMDSGFSNLDDIPGLYLPGPQGWRLTAERPVIADLDSLPWPRYSEIDFDDYTKPYLGLVGSRGCLGRCVFCSERHRFPGYRYRSAENQVDELEYLSERFPIEHFPYYDALANGDYDSMARKAQEIIRRGLDVDYSGNLMTRASMPDELFPLIRKSGFSVAFIGVESGSSATLAAMRKRHNPKMAAAFLKKCHDAGIRTELNFILGFPTETEEHFQETLDFVRDNRQNIDAIISVNTFIMGPSDLWNLRDKFGVVIEDADRSAHQWHTTNHRNDLDIRKKRIERFLALEEDLGLRGDVLISDEYSFGEPDLPDPATFLNTYLGHFEGEAPEAKQAARAAVKRAQIALRMRSASAAHMGHKLIASIRARGLRQTVRRGREWLQVRMNSRR